MWLKNFLMGLLFFTTILIVKGQGNEHTTASLKDSTVVNNVLQASKEKFGINPEEALNLANQAKDLSIKIGYKKGEANALKNIGTSLYILENPSEAITKWHEALNLFEEINDEIGMADLHGNIGIFYYNKGDNVKALDHYLKSLKIAESIGYKKVMVSALNNIGGIYLSNSSTYNKALDYYLKALPICEELGDNKSLGVISGNVGFILLKQKEFSKSLVHLNKALKAFEDNPALLPQALNNMGLFYYEQNDINKALDNYFKALKIGETTNNKHDKIKSIIGIAKSYMEIPDYKSSIHYFTRAESIGNEIGVPLELEDVYGNLAIAYQKNSDFKNAFKYQSLYTSIKDSLYNADYDKKVATLQFDFDLEKKENEISLLTKDKAIKDEELRRQRFAKNTFMVGLILIFIITYVIFRNYRNKVKVNRVLDRQKVQIEQLLLNILPAEVANELQTTGRATPRNYDHVSVLFTDFKGFTLIADKLSPEQLVRELNACFEAFDDIMIKNSIEKIKTVGDAYMCAGGIPVPDKNHPFRIVNAALEIKEYISKTNEMRRQSGQEEWEIRIGIHVGPLTAGVVGKKKYAYDIWGSTVNIASRMESSGVPGQVNISAATYDIIKEKYNCVYRGKIYAKNVGEVDMYLVDAKKGETGTIITDVEKRIEPSIKKEDHHQKAGSTLLQ